jgi:hypothetical protein
VIQNVYCWPEVHASTGTGSTLELTPDRSGFCGAVNVDGAVGLVGGVAESFEWTLSALRRSRYADSASVMNDLM